MNSLYFANADRYAAIFLSIMNPIEFKNKNNPDYEAQLSYLIKREFHVTYYRIRRYPYFLLGATVILLGLLQFTEPDNFIVLKSVSIALLTIVWLCSLIYLTAILIKWVKRNLWKKKSIAFAQKNESTYTLYFDEEKISFSGPNYKTELAWEYYQYWTEKNNSIFIFPPGSLYNAIYYSIVDLGVDNYKLLKDIASSKLTELSK